MAGDLSTCVECGCGFELTPDVKLLRQERFCSSRCQSVWYRRESPGLKEREAQLRCRVCDEVFAYRTYGPGRPKMYCSPECKRRAVFLGENAADRHRTIERECVCRHCGGKFVERRLTLSGGPRAYCSKRCVNAVKAERERRLYEKRRKTFAPRRCEVCQTEFVPANSRVRRCGSDSCKSFRRLLQYDLSLAGYHQMMDRQGHCCALCGGSFADGEIPNIDHCHDTGKVRGLLHQKCNAGIGLLDDSFERAYQASLYLARHTFDLRDLCRPAVSLAA